MTSVLTNLGLAVLMVSTPVREVTAISVSGWYLQSTRTPRMVEGEEGVGRILGTWQVVKIIDEGKEKRDPEMSGSVWTFRADALTLQSPAGKKVRFQIKFEPTATPPALYAEETETPQHESGWVIYRFSGETLEIAFFDGLGERPVGFEPEKRLVLLELKRIPRSVN